MFTTAQFTLTDAIRRVFPYTQPGADAWSRVYTQARYIVHNCEALHAIANGWSWASFRALFPQTDVAVIQVAWIYFDNQ